MSKVLDALRKRSHKTVSIDGADVHLRAMTLDEVRSQEKLEELAKAGFTIGCCLTNSDGSPAFPRDAAMTDVDFAEFVLKEIGDIPQDALQRLSAEIGKINTVANEEAIRKNS